MLTTTQKPAGFLDPEHHQSVKGVLAANADLETLYALESFLSI